MADAEGALERMLGKNLFKIMQLARSPANLKRGTGGAAHGDASRIVTAVLEASEPLYDDRNDWLRTYIPNDAAHTPILSDWRPTGCDGQRQRVPKLVHAKSQRGSFYSSIRKVNSSITDW